MRMCVKPGNAMLFEDNTGFYQLFFEYFMQVACRFPFGHRQVVEQTVTAVFRGGTRTSPSNSATKRKVSCINSTMSFDSKSPFISK